MLSIPSVRRLVVLVAAAAAATVLHPPHATAAEQPVCVKTPSHYVVCV